MLSNANRLIYSVLLLILLPARYFRFFRQVPEGPIASNSKSSCTYIINPHKTIDYRIRSNASPLLNIAPPCNVKSHVFVVFLEYNPTFFSKVHFLRDILNWTPPKNSFWKIEPRACIQADMLVWYENQWYSRK